MSQATGKKLKVICGVNTSLLADNEWIGDKTPVTLCDVRISLSNSVKPNVEVIELAEALTAGADAYLMKDCGRDELLQAIRELSEIPFQFTI